MKIYGQQTVYLDTIKKRKKKKKKHTNGISGMATTLALNQEKQTTMMSRKWREMERILYII